MHVFCSSRFNQSVTLQPTKRAHGGDEAAACSASHSRSFERLSAGKAPRCKESPCYQIAPIARIPLFGQTGRFDDELLCSRSNRATSSSAFTSLINARRRAFRADSCFQDAVTKHSAPTPIQSLLFNASSRATNCDANAPIRPPRSPALSPCNTAILSRDINNAFDEHIIV